MKKIAIVGSASDSKFLAPYSDQSWEIWGVNFGWRDMPRLDRLFELHKWHYLQETQSKHADHFQYLTNEQSIPIYVQEEKAEIPSGIAYPIDSIREKYGDYFTNTVSYMIALAIEEGATDIGLWGVNMSQAYSAAGEYSRQRPSCEYFVGLARGLGINVIIPPESDLLKTKRLYAFDIYTDGHATKLEAHIRDVMNRISDTKKKIADATGQIAQYINSEKVELEAKIKDRLDAHNAYVKEREEEVLYLTGCLDELNYKEQWEDG